MKPYFIIFALSLSIASPLLAQEKSARDSVLAEARQLKSLFRADKAIEILSTQVTSDFDEDILAELADCHLQNGNAETAADTYTLLSLRSPDNLAYKLKLMQIWFRLKAYPQCIAAGQEVLQRDSIPAVLSYVGDAFQQMAQPDSSLAYYQQSLALRPDNPSVIAKTGNLMLARNDPDGALALTSAFLQDNPDHPVVAPVCGVALFRKENYEEAACLFQRLEDQGNDSYALHNYLGQSYWQTGILYRAKQELLAAWQIDSSDVSLAYSLAAINAESRSGPFLETVKPWLDKAIEMTRPDPILMSRIHQQYAGGFFRVPDLDQSIFHYKEAYRYNPKLTPLLRQIAYCYELKKDPKNALTWYEKYLATATPGTQGYEFAAKSIEFLKAELFMTEPAR